MRTIPLCLETGRSLPRNLDRLYLHLQVFIGSKEEIVESGVWVWGLRYAYGGWVGLLCWGRRRPGGVKKDSTMLNTPPGNMRRSSGSRLGISKF
jgi:hypothetical protein